MTSTIILQLKYSVTGSVSAAKRAIADRYRRFLPGLEEFPGDGFHAKRYSSDVDPEEVSGYSNYPTFHVALFLSNNRPQYDQARELAKMAFAKGTDSADPNAQSEGILWLADELETLVTEGYISLEAREEDAKTQSEILINELLSASLGRVNWRELAEEWASTVGEEAA
jgi:hypothetical protein